MAAHYMVPSSPSGHTADDVILNYLIKWHLDSPTPLHLVGIGEFFTLNFVSVLYMGPNLNGRLV